RTIVRSLLVLLAAAVAAGCSSRAPEPPRKGPPPLEPRYEDGAAGLRALWSDLLAAARRDERDKVHDLMASLTMSEEDLVALFGAERGRWLAPRYAPMIARLVNIGAMELVAQIADRKYDDVEVYPVDERS